MNEIQNVGIWLRVSTDMQAQTDALEHHEMRARGYATSKEWKVVKVYNLSGVSGKSVIDHPETQRMIKDVKSGEISALIFSKLARLTRNTRELLDFADLFQDHNAGLVSLQESIDTTTAGGRLFYTMIAAMNQWERDEIASRVAASVPIRAELGKPLGGQSTFGYTWVNKKLVPHKDEAPIRRQIYELFDLHKRKRKVARILNEQGFRTRSGAQFSECAIERLIRDSTAKGVHRRNFTKTQGKGKPWLYKDESEWIYNTVEPIISEALWDSCNQFLDQQKAASRKKGRTPKHLFSGILYCHCGSVMYPYNSKSGYTCKTCKNKMPMAAITEIVDTELTRALTNPEKIESLLSDANATVQAHTHHIKKLEVKIKKTQAQMDSILDLYRADAMGIDSFKEKYRPLEEEVGTLKASVSEARLEFEQTENSNLSPNTVIEQGQKVVTDWNFPSRTKKRKVIETFVEKITIRDRSVDIRLDYAPLFTRGEKTGGFTWVTGGNQQKISRILHTLGGSGDIDFAGFQRFPELFQSRPGKLSEFIQKQNAFMCHRYLTGPGVRAAPD